MNDCREAGLALAQCIVLEVWVQIRLRISGLPHQVITSLSRHIVCTVKTIIILRSPNLIGMDANCINCSPNAWLKVVAREGDSESLHNCIQLPSRGIVIVCLSSLWCMPRSWLLSYCPLNRVIVHMDRNMRVKHSVGPVWRGVLQCFCNRLRASASELNMVVLT